MNTLKRAIAVLALAVGTVAITTTSAGATGTDHPNCAGRIEISVNAPSYTVQADHAGLTHWVKAGNNPHFDFAAPNAGDVIGPNTVSGWPTNKKGKPLDISHVDVCPEPPATTVPPSTTEPPATTTPPDTTEPPATTVPLTTEPPATTIPPCDPPHSNTVPCPTTPPTTEPRGLDCDDNETEGPDPLPCPPSTTTSPTTAPPTTQSPTTTVAVIDPPVPTIPLQPDKCLLFIDDTQSGFTGSWLPEDEYVLTPTWDEAKGMTSWRFMPCRPVETVTSSTQTPASGLPATGSSSWSLTLPATLALTSGSVLTWLARRRQATT